MFKWFDEESKYRLDAEREKKKEKQDWLDEYHHRTNDPYWKNDSDYDY